jgi:hypothetical protein
MIPERAVTLTTSDGAVLEARLALTTSPVAGLVVCHPHPLYGGDMANPVVVRVAEVCAGLGFATLRFNFRGVGGSTGRHGRGRDEERDVEAALTILREVLGGTRPLALAGYSFGATVAARVVARGSAEPVAALALVAPPVAVTGEETFLALAPLAGRLLIVAGSQDEHCPGPALEALGRRVPHATLRVIDGANHFFFGKLSVLGAAVAGWAERLKPGQAAGCGGAG